MSECKFDEGRVEITKVLQSHVNVKKKRSISCFLNFTEKNMNFIVNIVISFTDCYRQIK